MASLRHALSVFLLFTSTPVTLAHGGHQHLHHHRSLHSLEDRATSDFNFLSFGPGQCGPDDEKLIQTWMDDVLKNLVPSALDALGEYMSTGSELIGKTLQTLMGVDYDPATKKPKNTDDVVEVYNWFDDVADYLNGEFESDDYPKGYWLMCRDGFLREQTYDDAALDSNGNTMQKPGDEPGVLTIRDLSASKPYIAQGLIPFWGPFFKSYIWMAESLVRGPNAGVNQCREKDGLMAYHLAADGKSMLTFCPAVLTMKEKANEITLKEGDYIDSIRTGGSWLLHESMHAIRPTNSPDHAYGAAECKHLVDTNNKMMARVAPDCAADFAVAMFHQLKQGWQFQTLSAKKV